MATLVLGAAGSWVGSFFGPLGSAIGWSIGSALGTLLDPPKTEGPKLTDLKLQTSQYGQPIPIVYGRVRVAGNVIWTTDMHEHETTSSGKGGPVVVETTYTASFAVLICQGPIIAITRVWADGRLVQDNTTYDNQLSFIFTTYLGTEDQLPDPTMESFLGIGQFPAHRGLAYVVFDELELTEFGNRLPHLEFEVMTVAHEDAQLHVVQQVLTDYVYNYSSFGGEGGIGNPFIMQWPSLSGEFIKVKRMSLPLGSSQVGPEGDPTGLGIVMKYDPVTLEFVDSDAYPGPGRRNLQPTILVPGISGARHFTLFTVGMVEYNGAIIDVYTEGSFNNTTQAINQNPTLTNQLVWSDDGVNLWTAMELAYDAGIPANKLVHGAYFTQDRTAWVVFAGDQGPQPIGDRPHEWYMIENNVVIDSGVVDQTPSAAVAGWWNFGQGGENFANVGQFENNREWLWVYSGAGFANSAACLRIDPATK